MLEVREEQHRHKRRPPAPPKLPTAPTPPMVQETHVGRTVTEAPDLSTRRRPAPTKAFLGNMRVTDAIVASEILAPYDDDRVENLPAFRM